MSFKVQKNLANNFSAMLNYVVQIRALFTAKNSECFSYKQWLSNIQTDFYFIAWNSIAKITLGIKKTKSPVWKELRSHHSTLASKS